MSDAGPRVSIGMPVYNGDEFLRQSLDSMVAQTYGDFELVICDNASTDSTEAIAREYARQDDRIRYYRNDRNLGAAPNFNRTVELSTGEYFKWLAHDDVLAPEYLERCVTTLDSAPRAVVLCFPRRVFIDAQGREVRDCDFVPQGRSRLAGGRGSVLLFMELVGLPNACIPAVVFGLVRRDALDRTRLIGSYVASDLVLTAELSLLGELWQIPDRLFYQRRHERTSWRATLSRREEAEWFNPRSSQRAIIPPIGRVLAEYLRAIGRAELSGLRKIRYCLQLRAALIGRLSRMSRRVMWQTWSWMTLQAVRAVAVTLLPMRIWAFLRLVRAGPRWGWIAAARDAWRMSEDELLRASAESLVRRGDRRSEAMLSRWLADGSGPRHEAASSALSGRPDHGADLVPAPSPLRPQRGPARSACSGVGGSPQLVDPRSGMARRGE